MLVHKICTIVGASCLICTNAYMKEICWGLNSSITKIRVLYWTYWLCEFTSRSIAVVLILERYLDLWTKLSARELQASIDSMLLWSDRSSGFLTRFALEARCVGDSQYLVVSGPYVGYVGGARITVDNCIFIIVFSHTTQETITIYIRFSIANIAWSNVWKWDFDCVLL